MCTFHEQGPIHLHDIKLPPTHYGQQLTTGSSLLTVNISTTLTCIPKGTVWYVDEMEWDRMEPKGTEVMCYICTHRMEWDSCSIPHLVCPGRNGTND